MTAPSPVCQVTASLRPEEYRGLALVVERLAVAADQFYLLAKAPLRRQHGLGVEFRQQEIQSGQFGHAGLRRVHRFQHSLADILRVRIFGVGDEFERQVREASTRAGESPAPHNPDQGYVDAVGGGSAHDSCDDHA